MGLLKDRMEGKGQKPAAQIAAKPAPAAQRPGFPEPILTGPPPAARAPGPPPLPKAEKADEARPIVQPKASSVRVAPPAPKPSAVPPRIPDAPVESDDSDNAATLVSTKAMLAGVDTRESMHLGSPFQEDPLLGNVDTGELAGPGSALAGVEPAPAPAAPESVQDSAPLPLASSSAAVPAEPVPLGGISGSAPPAAAEPSTPAPTVAKTKMAEKTIAFQNSGDKGTVAGYTLTYIGSLGITTQKFNLKGKGVDEVFALRVGDVKTYTADGVTVKATGKEQNGAQKQVHLSVETPEKAKASKAAKAAKTKEPKAPKEEKPSMLKEYVHEITVGICTAAVATAALVAPGVSEALGAVFVPVVAAMYAVPGALVLISALRRRKEVKEEMKNTDKVV